MAGRCYLLEIPQELRVRIYEQLYGEPYHCPSNARGLRVYDQLYPFSREPSHSPADARSRAAFAEPIRCLLLLRNSKIIELFLQPHHRYHQCKKAALLQTCRTVHSEAAPVLYAMSTCHVLVYFIDHCPPSLQFAGPLNRSNDLLRNIRHLKVTAVLRKNSKFDEVAEGFRLLRTLADALDDAEADIKTLSVKLGSSSSRMEASIVRARSATLDLLQQDHGTGLVRAALYEKMMQEASGQKV